MPKLINFSEFLSHANRKLQDFSILDFALVHTKYVNSFFHYVFLKICRNSRYLIFFHIEISILPHVESFNL